MSILKYYVLYDLIYITFSKIKKLEMENRLVVVRSKGWGEVRNGHEYKQVCVDETVSNSSVS